MAIQAIQRQSKRARFDANWSLPIAILVLTAAVYLPSASHYFVSDDFTILQAVKRIDGASWVSDVVNPTNGILTSVFYRPVSVAFFWLRYQVFGLNPLPWNLTNLALHLVCTSCVYVLVKQVCRTRIAVLSMLVFGLHYVHVEPVLWVSASMDLLASLFVLEALIIYTAISRNPPFGRGYRIRIVALLLVSLLAFFSKESSVVLVGLMFLVLVFSRQSQFTDAVNWTPILGVGLMTIGYLVFRLLMIAWFDINITT